MINKLKNMIKRGWISGETADKGQIPNIQVSYGAGEQIRTTSATMIFPYGMQANPILETATLLVSIMGDESNLSNIPYCRDERFKQLKTGEVVFGSPATGSYIKFSENKDIVFNSLANVDFSATVGENIFNHIQLNNLTASRMMASSTTKVAESTNLHSWVHSTSLSVASETNGGVNINISDSYIRSILSATLPITYDDSTGVISLNSSSLKTNNYLVQRDGSGAASLNLNDDNATPRKSVDANNRYLVSDDGNNVVRWSNDGLKVFNGVYEQFSANVNGITSVQGLSFYNFGAVLSRYDSNYAEVTMTGIWDAKPQIVNVWFEIIGTTVTFLFPDVIASADTATFITVSGIPGPYPIKEFRHFIAQTVDNAIDSTTGSLVIFKTDGVIEIYNGTGNFSGAGDSGFKAFCVTYNVTQG